MSRRNPQGLLCKTPSDNCSLSSFEFIRTNIQMHQQLDTADLEFCLCQSIISLTTKEARYHTVHILPRISSYFNEPETDAFGILIERFFPFMIVELFEG